MPSTFTKGALQPHRHDSNLTDQSATPAPGEYDQRSSLAMQIESKNRTQASVKFGRSTRDATERQYISAKHSRSQPSNYGKECFYGDLDGTASIGRQLDSRLQTEPSIGFTRNARFKGNINTVTKDVDFANWDYSSLEKQIKSKNRTQASVKFGNEKRNCYNKMYLSKEHSAKLISNLTSQVDFIESNSTLGKQVLSTLPSGEVRGWGTEMRGHQKKRYYGL